MQVEQVLEPEPELADNRKLVPAELQLELRHIDSTKHIQDAQGLVLV